MQLGNPVLEYATDFNSRAEFFWSHGLISDTTYRMFTSSCNYSRYVSEYYRGSLSPICSKVMSLVTTETSKFVDKYDVTLDVCISSVLSQSKALAPQVQKSFIEYIVLAWMIFSQLLHGLVGLLTVANWVLRLWWWIAASHWERWRVCGGQDCELLESEGCSEGLSRSSRWSQPVARLQQVKVFVDYTHNAQVDGFFLIFLCAILLQHFGLRTAWSRDTYDQRGGEDNPGGNPGVGIQWWSRLSHTSNWESKARTQAGAGVETAFEHALSGVVCWDAGELLLLSWKNEMVDLLLTNMCEWWWCLGWRMDSGLRRHPLVCNDPRSVSRSSVFAAGEVPCAVQGVSRRQASTSRILRENLKLKL